MLAKTILIVDDMLTLRQSARIILERQGYVVTEAGDGQEALQKIAESPPDLVLLDLMMPTMSGLDVLEHIEADEALQGFPIIVLTAVADRREMRRFIEMGVTDYLLKPFTPTALLSQVRRALGEEETSPAW
ncbi:MAG: response regulator [Anaerolineae bacterium]|nr:MAG: response regulator [Anaerolineae bacterium]